MTGHFSTHLIDADGNWLKQTERYNSSADIAPTAAQMPRSVGLALASVLYRKNAELKGFDTFSNNGNEITWISIGNASTAEGHFWEAVNAIGVLHAPAIISIYDDGYGISVPNEFQMVKENIYAILQGFQRVPCPAEQCDRGYDLYQVLLGIIPPCFGPTRKQLTRPASITFQPWCTSLTPLNPRGTPPQAPKNATNPKNASSGSTKTTACVVTASI